MAFYAVVADSIYQDKDKFPTSSKSQIHQTRIRPKDGQMYPITKHALPKILIK